MKLSFHPRFHGCLSRPYEGSRQSHLLWPKRNATDHRFSSVAGCATGSTRSSSAHGWSGHLSLYFGLFVYQVHIVATEAGVSRRFACVELWRIPLPHTGVKIVSAVALFHSFGVARQGPWITWVNKDCLLCQVGSSGFANSFAPSR